YKVNDLALSVRHLTYHETLPDQHINLPNKSIVIEHGLSSEITQGPGGSSDTSERSKNNRSFKDSGRSYMKTLKTEHPLRREASRLHRYEDPPESPGLRGYILVCDIRKKGRLSFYVIKEVKGEGKQQVLITAGDKKNEKERKHVIITSRKQETIVRKSRQARVGKKESASKSRQARVDKVKEGHDGKKNYKAGLVVKGFQHKQGVDYKDIFSPVVNMATISFMQRAWYKRCAMDHCCYLKKVGSSSIILLLYVDDMLVAGSDVAEIKKVKR
ncbi:retrovirus-related pol polyprotein from transposon TNT 1-94, partial [Tanacetum coccineum]